VVIIVEFFVVRCAILLKSLRVDIINYTVSLYAHKVIKCFKI